MLGAVAWGVREPGHVDQAAELVVLLRYHWIAGGQLSDGRRWLERVLGLEGLDPGRRGQLLATLAWVTLIQGDRATAADCLDQAASLARGLGDRSLAAQVDAWSGLRHLFSGELPEAITCYERAIPVLEQMDELGLALTARFQMAMAQTMAGSPEDARVSCRIGIETSRAHGEQWNRAYSLWVRSLCAWHQNRLDEAVHAGREALEIQQSFQDGICIALQLLVLSWVAGRLGDHHQSRRLARSADVVWGLIGTDVHAFGPDLAAEHQRLTPMTTAPDEDRPRTRAEAVAQGLAFLPTAISRVPSAAMEAGLTRREQEILSLLVLGRSNRAIAEGLVISTRTVEGHVANILSKLALSSRAEVVAWSARQQARPTGVSRGRAR